MRTFAGRTILSLLVTLAGARALTLWADIFFARQRVAANMPLLYGDTALRAPLVAALPDDSRNRTLMVVSTVRDGLLSCALVESWHRLAPQGTRLQFLALADSGEQFSQETPATLCGEVSVRVLAGAIPKSLPAFGLALIGGKGRVAYSTAPGTVPPARVLSLVR